MEAQRVYCQLGTTFLNGSCLQELIQITHNLRGYFLVLSWLGRPSGRAPVWASSITFRHTTFGRTPLDEWWAHRRDLYLATYNTHKRKISMPPAGFKPTVPSSKRPQTHALDRAAIGIGCRNYCARIEVCNLDFSFFLGTYVVLLNERNCGIYLYSDLPSWPDIIRKIKWRSTRRPGH